MTWASAGYTTGLFRNLLVKHRVCFAQPSGYFLTKSFATLRFPRGHLLASFLVLCLPVAAIGAPQNVDTDGDDGPAKPVTDLIVTARRLDAARENIVPNLGASTYTLSNAAVEDRPGSETTKISQVLLQVPGVLQDGSGQLHVRQSQGALQYLINNVIIPEGLSDLGESLSARIAQKITLTTGTLPAQYGFQAGGVINVTTKNGAYLNGGQAELYGGGNGKIEPALEYGTSRGPTNIFGSVSYQRNDVGLASLDGSSSPLHDRTEQVDGFGFLDHVFDPETRASLIVGLSDDRFQLPNLRGLNAATSVTSRATYTGPLTVNGVANYPSESLDNTRRESTHYAVASILHATDKASIQAAGFYRQSRLTTQANSDADIAFKGIGQDVDERDDAYGLQLDISHELAEAHTVRLGGTASWNLARTNAQARALRVDSAGRPTSDVPRSFNDPSRLRTRRASAFLQDEWRATSNLTINLGVRFDEVHAVTTERHASPRLSAVWTIPDGPVFHIGYARYFLPAPQEAAGETPIDFVRTTAATPTATGDALKSETDDYYDVGVGWTVGHLTLGLDAYLRAAQNLIAEGQFGPAHLVRAFNYKNARLRGVELSGTYAKGNFSAWVNLAIAGGHGRTITSNQYYFTAAELAELASGLVALGQDQRVTASAGLSRRFGRLLLSGDAIIGSGLPNTPAGGRLNGSHFPGYAQINFAAVYTVAKFNEHPPMVRIDVFNALDTRYRLRDGTGLGDVLPQWGPRRGILFGIEQSF